ncbi:MAG: immune inhibitor A, partial [Acidimicrobiia bacterium]|nr:immune inhibitor A [Acidimicrobiia bacterium]
MKGKLFITMLVMGLLIGVLATTAVAAPSGDGEPDLSGRVDNRIDPLGAAQAELKAKAFEAQLNGKIPMADKVMEVARGQFVELAREGEDPVWTMLGEFGDFPHNNIAEPDRSV